MARSGVDGVEIGSDGDENKNHAALTKPLADEPPPMSKPQVIKALSGLLLGMFVAMLSGTIVTNALPIILAELHGTQAHYTWVVTAALLATTASTPIWGKLADLVSKKLLVQLALGVFVIGSVLAGMSESPGMLITFRAVQGLGGGGLMALSQVIMAAMIPPRERGRYSGYLGAVFAAATIGGPLIGGLIVDTVGWRGCFYAGIPIAVLAVIVLQKTLRLPVLRRTVKIDYLGAALITSAASLLLIWVTLAGTRFPWASWNTLMMTGGTVLLVTAFLLVERRAAEPVVPLRLFRNRTVALATAASFLVGTTAFSITVLIGQYFQLSRGNTPTEAGLLTLPMIAGMVGFSTGAGNRITRTGRWKRWLTAGTLLIAAGFGVLSLTGPHTGYPLLALGMALIGSGLGMSMQNQVLAVQNVVDTKDLGAASSAVVFFRTLGGAIGVSALGALLATRVSTDLSGRLSRLGVDKDVLGGGGTRKIPDLDSLSGPVRRAVQTAYGESVGEVYLVVVPVALLALVVTLLIREVPLRRRIGGGGEAGGAADAPADGPADAPAGASTSVPDPTPAPAAVPTPASADGPADQATIK